MVYLIYQTALNKINQTSINYLPETFQSYEPIYNEVLLCAQVVILFHFI
jgi:hypothetical protein